MSKLCHLCTTSKDHHSRDSKWIGLTHILLCFLCWRKLGYHASSLFIKADSSLGEWVYFSRQEAPERKCLKLWEFVQIFQIRLMCEVSFFKNNIRTVQTLCIQPLTLVNSKWRSSCQTCIGSNTRYGTGVCWPSTFKVSSLSELCWSQMFKNRKVRNVGTPRLWNPESFIMRIRLFDGFLRCSLRGHL